MQLTQYLNNAKSLDELLVIIKEHHNLLLENDKLFYDFGGNVNDVIALDIIQKFKKLPSSANVDFFQRIESISDNILKSLTEEERLAFHNKMKANNMNTNENISEKYTFVFKSDFDKKLVSPNGSARFRDNASEIIKECMYDISVFAKSVHNEEKTVFDNEKDLESYFINNGLDASVYVGIIIKNGEPIHTLSLPSFENVMILNDRMDFKLYAESRIESLKYDFNDFSASLNGLVNKSITPKSILGSGATFASAKEWLENNITKLKSDIERGFNKTTLNNYFYMNLVAYPQIALSDKKVTELKDLSDKYGFLVRNDKALNKLEDILSSRGLASEATEMFCSVHELNDGTYIRTDWTNDYNACEEEFIRINQKYELTNTTRFIVSSFEDFSEALPKTQEAINNAILLSEYEKNYKDTMIDTTPLTQDDLPPARDIFEIEKEIEEMDKKARASVGTGLKV